MEPKLPGLDGIFVIHCKTGYADRAHSIEAQLGGLPVGFEYILEKDADELTEADQRNFAPHLSPGTRSVICKHRLAHQKAYDRGYERCLVLEDDALLSKDFGDRLPLVLAESRSLGDDHTVFLSSACHMYTPRSRIRKGQALYEHDASRAADSYILTHTACRKRLEWLKHHEVKWPIDHLFNHMDPEVGLKFLWLGEPIVEQGSENGRFSSWVEGNPPAWLTSLKWNAEKLYKKHILRNLK
ncbi:MAG: glycosyl transferase [Bdellovibrionota bacterium]